MEGQIRGIVRDQIVDALAAPVPYSGYHFDTVRYFHDAPVRTDGEPLDKGRYVKPRALWQAMTSEHPRVLLIDEIDKA